MCKIRAPLAIVILPVIISYIFLMNSTVDEMANSGLLYLSNISKAHAICHTASKYVRKVLYVKIKGTPENTGNAIINNLDSIYTKASSICGNIDIRLMLKPTEPVHSIKTSQPIDVILYDSDLAMDIDKLKQSVTTLNTDFEVQKIDCEDSNERVTGEPIKRYEFVALGGTFDRLHNGHKILLSQAAGRATKHVAVGVTDVNMIKSKKLWELIQPVEVRIQKVKNFLNDINPDVEYDVFPLQDLYGPTKDDPKYELIVVSEETLPGAAKINEKRKENGLKPMDVHVIGLAQDSHPERTDEEEVKVSSSNQRMRLLGTLLRPPVPNPNIPDWPYVIGLAGGIASGKSNITEKLKAKGAAIINCDIIAHELYKPGLPLNSTVAENFDNVVSEDGEIDRRRLAQIVFNDKDQLEKLNSLVWPAVLEETQRRIRAFGEQGYKVVVMEAAVMVKAQWYKYCHQLWSVIIPRDEAIKRLQKRNGMTQEEAAQRVDSLPSNQEQVAPANVVFSPYWSYEYTQGQIDRAWQQLQEYLRTRN